LYLFIHIYHKITQINITHLLHAGEGNMILVGE